MAGKTIRTVGPTVASTTVDDSAPFPMTAVTRPRAAEIAAGLARAVRSVPWAVCLITVFAAVLRFVELDDVTGNHFYDAAVRSMTLSWHNLFYGAFDPGALLSVDKPPLDLWLQVLSVKLFGWNASALKIPEALAGTLAVPLLYDAVRRVAGAPAAIAAALALAVLPESVLTARSDTMDSVMMLLVVAALWLTIRAVNTGRNRPVILAGVMLGLAFNVKLLEALIAAPALLIFFVVASSATWRRKIAGALLAGVALVVVGLSWATAVSLSPGHHPYPVGSTDGTVWNVMFVFNGFGRVASAVHHRTGGPGLLRLVESSGWHFDRVFGCVLISALVLGGVAMITALARRRGGPASTGDRLARAFALALVVWIVVAVALFDHVAVLHARYFDALAPAVAAAIGFGAASLAGLRSSRAPSVPAIVVALGLICAYTFALSVWSVGWEGVGLSVAAVGAALLARSGGVIGRGAKWLTALLIMGTTVLFPIHESVSLVRAHTSDSIGLATHAPATERALSSYLVPRTFGIRYELAVDEPLALAPMVVSDQRPILPLTSFRGAPLVGLTRLKAAVRSGEVRYGLVGMHKCKGAGDISAACVPAARWIRQNGIDVSRAAGVGHGVRLYLLLPY